MKNNKLLYGIFVVIAVAGVGILLLVEKIDEAPTIESIVPTESILPTSGFFGAEIIIHGSGFTPNNNDVGFILPQRVFAGRKAAYLNHITSSDGKTLRFNLTVLLSACAFSQMRESEACILIGIPLPTGRVEIFVANKNGISNRISFTVTRAT